MEKIKSDETLKKEVKKIMNDIDKQYGNSYNKKKSIKSISSKKEDSAIKKNFVKNNTKNEIKKEKEKIKKMNPSEKAKWLEDRYDSLGTLLNILLKSDFLNGTTYDDRCFIILYMYELLNILNIFDVVFSAEMVDKLLRDNYLELLSMLEILNYI